MRQVSLATLAGRCVGVQPDKKLGLDVVEITSERDFRFASVTWMYSSPVKGGMQTRCAKNTFQSENKYRKFEVSVALLYN